MDRTVHGAARGPHGARVVPGSHAEPSRPYTKVTSGSPVIRDALWVIDAATFHRLPLRLLPPQMDQVTKSAPLTRLAT